MFIVLPFQLSSVPEKIQIKKFEGKKKRDMGRGRRSSSLVCCLSKCEAGAAAATAASWGWRAKGSLGRMEKPEVVRLSLSCCINNPWAASLGMWANKPSFNVHAS